MISSKNTKRALLASILSVALCCAMLIGSTFAWFTDSVTSTGNIIKSGTLDVEMKWAYGTESLDSAKWKDASEGAIFDYDLWEPGYTEVRHVKISNIGSLALKYEVRIAATGEVSELADVIDVYYIKGGDQITDRTQLNDANKIGTLAQVLANPYAAKGNLLGKKGETVDADIATIALKMQESAGNEYQDLSIGSEFAIQLVATQDTVESDNFDNQYDERALYPVLPTIINSTVTGTIGGSNETTLSSENATVVVPANAVPVTENVQFRVQTKESTADSVTYDISLTDSEGNPLTLSAEVTVTLSIGRGLANVAVAHNGAAMDPSDYSYNSTTGILTITTDSFSPFRITYDTRYAAEVNGVGYITLEEAVAASAQNDVIYLLQDVEMTQDIQTNAQLAVEAGRTVTLDLAGHKITSNYAGITIVNYGTLTINDSKGNGIVHNISTEIGENYSHDAVRNYGRLTINGGIFGDNDTNQTNANTEHRGAALRNMEGAVCEVNGGTFTCGDNYYTWGDSTSFSYAIRSSGTLTINDGILYGAMNGGVSADAGQIVINGGSFSVSGKTSYYVLVTSKSAGGKIIVNGGTFTKTGGNGGLLGGFSGMPSWDAAEDLAANGYTITSGTFIRDGETVTLP